MTQPFYTTEELRDYIENVHFDGFVVGSNQVWRPDYNKNGMLENMFLDITGNEAVKRVAYAVSFGVDIWEYSEEQTRICKELIRKFDAISVREKSGLKLCSDYLCVEATHVLDPTMLLDTGDYNSLIDKQHIGKVDGGLFCYILDTSSTKLNAMDYVEKATGLKRYICLQLVPENSYTFSIKRVVCYHRRKNGFVASGMQKW